MGIIPGELFHNPQIIQGGIHLRAFVDGKDPISGFPADRVAFGIEETVAERNGSLLECGRVFFLPGERCVEFIELPGQGRIDDARDREHRRQDGRDCLRNGVFLYFHGANIRRNKFENNFNIF